MKEKEKLLKLLKEGKYEEYTKEIYERANELTKEDLTELLYELDMS